MCLLWIYCWCSRAESAGLCIWSVYTTLLRNSSCSDLLGRTFGWSRSWPETCMEPIMITAATSSWQAGLQLEVAKRTVMAARREELGCRSCRRANWEAAQGRSRSEESHSFIHWLIHWMTYRLIGSFFSTLVDTNSLIHWFIDLLIHSLIDSLLHSIIG